MRLTLRTLLAYLDDVLDPVDKEELAQKIESSEFAEDLVHRTRDTVRRLRLSAPQVIGTGMGLDPNTVAEYLDNVMPPEQVGDFERICLESDVHLAEATACHHVLTMVLGEPADVDPLARQRMYSIATAAGERKQLRIEPAHLTPAAAIAAAPVPQFALAPSYNTGHQLRTTEIPEYLRAGAWWRSTAALIGLAVVVVVGTTILIVSSGRGWFGRTSTAEPLTAQNSTPSVPPLVVAGQPPVAEPRIEVPELPAADNNGLKSVAGPPQPSTPGISAPVATTPAAPAHASNAPPSVEPDRYAANASPASTPSANTPPPLPPAIAIPATQPESSGNNASSVAAPAAPQPPSNTTTDVSRIPAAPAEVPANLPTAAPGSESISAPATRPNPLPSVPPPLPPAADLATSKTVAPNSGSPPLDRPAPPSSAEPKGTLPNTTPAAPPIAGTYLGGNTVLLRHDDKANAWFRVEARAVLVPGERVLALPEFRPRIALASGLQLEISGGTQIVLRATNDSTPAGLGAAADAPSSIDLVYGRIVLFNPAKAGRQIALMLGPNSGTAQIAPNSKLAVEVERKHVPGVDPRQTASPVEVHLYAPHGGIVWKDAAGEKSITKPSRWSIAANTTADAVDDPAPPEWIDQEPIVLLSEQKYGAPVIETTLTSDVPVETQLLELFKGSSRKEVKSLVARCSIHVGVFGPFIDALRDSDQKANWKTHIDALRAAMALSPESAGKVWQALVDQRGKPAATDLYEMLCGYAPDQVGQTTEQMKIGPLAKLIGWLEEDSLDYRVLAVQNLWELTGKRLMVNPAASLADRTQNVKRWRARLDAGELKPVSQP